MTNLTSTDVEWVAHVVVMPIILLIGFIGQVLNLITLHQPRLKGVTFLYLKAVAFADFFVILTLIPFVIRQAYENVKVEWPCWVLFYSAHLEIPLANAFMAANTLCIVGLTVERYFSVCHPLWALKANGTPKRARIVIGVLYGVAFVFFVPAAFQKKLQPSQSVANLGLDPSENYGDKTTCTDWTIVRNHELHGQKEFKIYLLFREIFVRIGPTLILIILNIAIFRAVRKTSTKRRRLISIKRFSSRRRSSRQRPGFVKPPAPSEINPKSVTLSGSVSAIEDGPTPATPEGDEPDADGEQQPPPAATCGTNSDNRTLVIRYRRTRREKNDQERQRRVYVLLIITVLTFLICTIPASVLSLLVTDHNSNEDSLAFQAFRAAANLLESLSFAINFYIYCLCSEDYRKIFLKWLRRCADAIYRCRHQR